MVARMEWKAKGKEKGNRMGKGILISLLDCKNGMVRGKKTTTIQMNKNTLH